MWITLKHINSMKNNFLLAKGKPGIKIYGILENHLCISTASVYIIKNK